MVEGKQSQEVFTDYWLLTSGLFLNHTSAELCSHAVALKSKEGCSCAKSVLRNLKVLEL